MASNIQCTEECLTEAARMSGTGLKNPRPSYMIFKITKKDKKGKEKIECVKTGAHGSTFEDLKKDVIDDDKPCYILYDEPEAGKLVLLVYSLDTFDVNDKFMLSSSKANFMKVVNVAENNWLHISDHEELDEAETNAKKLVARKI